MSARGRRMSRGISIVAAVLLSTLSTMATPARAEVTVSVVDGVLTITGDEAGDSVRIQCRGGNVLVNDVDPSTGPAPCSSIVAIEFTGGGGDDVIDLTRLSPETFTTLATTTLVGGQGDDRLTGGPFADTIDAGPGNDRIDPGAGSDVVEGGRGEDALSLRATGELALSDEMLTHAGGSSALAGIESAQVQAADSSTAVSFDASGFSGPVTLSGSDMDDTLIGGGGADRISGGEGSDSLRGGPGDDSLDPGPGSGQQVDGGKGSDTLTLPVDGDVTVTDGSLSGAVEAALSRIEILRVGGGDANDRIDAGGFTGAVFAQGGAGDDVIVTGDGDDAISGGAGNDRLNAGAGNDLISGEDGDDVLRGGAGNDRMSGGSGADVLRGGAGDDRLDGGAGRDTCLGGPGANSLVSC